MKWLWRIAAAVLLAGFPFGWMVLVPVATPAYASATANIIVTVTFQAPGAIGYPIDTPTTFSATRVTDQQVRLDWALPSGATQAMIRAKVGASPEDRNDGWQVYYGTATTFDDTAPNLDEMGSNVYYRIFFEGTDWLATTYDDDVGGIGVTQIAQVLAVFVLFGLTFWRRDIFLYIITCPVAITFGLSWYDTYPTSSGFTFSLALAGIGLYCLWLAIYNLVKSKE